MTKLITLRDDQVPIHLVVLRMGSTTLSDNALGQACERTYASLGGHAFSADVPHFSMSIWPPTLGVQV